MVIPIRKLNVLLRVIVAEYLFTSEQIYEIIISTSRGNLRFIKLNSLLTRLINSDRKFVYDCYIQNNITLIHLRITHKVAILSVL